MSYAIRLTFEYVQMAGVVKRICDQADVVVVYEHDESERKHIHLYTEGLTATVQTIKNWVVKDLGFKVNKSDWSFKTAKDRNFITYMSKGKLKPTKVKGICDEDIELFRLKWIERTTVKKDKKELATGWTMAKELAEWIDSKSDGSSWYFHDGQFISSGGDEIVTQDDVIRKCIKIHNKYEKPYCDFSLARVIQTAYGCTQKGSWKLRLVESVKQKLALRT